MILLPTLQQTARELEHTFQTIPSGRKALLNQLIEFISRKREAGEAIKLVFICTHNSRRSHMAQIWAQAAASYYNIPAVKCYSAGTEATAFNPKAITAMQRLGFDIQGEDDADNPKYKAFFSEEADPLEVWSKQINDAANPKTGFCAIMTCSDADENCPFIEGAEIRIGITYDDPKAFDGTSQEKEKYLERALQIGREMLYVFHKAR
ncbi:protein-tyrosine-phosphatase [Pontibacter ruber]|uniref:Protein-tyrosine-phosphatase n=1 Tax=Pontibacter ruber TaxID=1343895 RepID=A0ABW5D0T4_9BACT|nr:protein-tyrosine-phosphatase [Pontibacter ruber]